MSTQAEFVSLESKNQWLNVAINSLTQLYSKYDRILVLAKERKDLEQLDELLWHNSSQQFIPYSLDTECYGTTAAVLLTNNQPENIRYQALLNIGGELLSNHSQFRGIIEVVQVDEESKEKARNRYKNYRQLGFEISHRTIDKSN